LDQPKSTKIAAYFYGEQVVCPKCIRELVVPFYRIADTGRTTESILNEAASIAGIDRADEASFNTRQFPKVIYASEIIKGLDSCYLCLREP
jgi:hypothetical protein